MCVEMETARSFRSIKSTARSNLSTNSTISQKSEWYCHCCSARNHIKEDKCRICGRAVTYADGPHLPLHDNGRYVLRANQVATVLPGDHIHDANEMNWTALHSCASVGNRELVMELLDQGSEIEATTVEGYTPLHLAVFSGSLETVAVLISRKCNVNAQTFFELNTPLHIAVQEGWRSICQYLIGAGTNTSLVNALGRTPLHLAAITGRIDIGHYFLENKLYSVHTQDGMGWNLQQIAEYYGHHDFEELCVRYTFTDNQYKIREIQKGDWDCELWRDVVQIKKQYEKKLENDERVYSVRDVLTSRRNDGPFLMSSSASDISRERDQKLIPKSILGIGTLRNFQQRNNDNEIDTPLSPLSVSTSRSISKSTPGSQPQPQFQSQSQSQSKYALAAQRNLKLSMKS
jgi:hypothetical protein